jgi:hypothetical protein
MSENMQIHVGSIVTTLVSVKRGKEYRTYIVEYDTETNTFTRITYLGEGRKVEVGARILEEMNEIVKTMGLKFP